jgi:hypothetical protein
MVMSRFVQVGLTCFGGEAELLFEFLAGEAAFEDAVELFGVDVEGGFFCATTNIRRRRVLLDGSA